VPDAIAKNFTALRDDRIKKLSDPAASCDKVAQRSVATTQARVRIGVIAPPMR
jgi:hypothetical protein